MPFAPGGGTDVVARTLAQEMAGDLGASIVIENKPGAGTILGTQAVATSEPDGYTLLMGTFANAVNPNLKAKLPYDPHADFKAVALIAGAKAEPERGPRHGREPAARTRPLFPRRGGALAQGDPGRRRHGRIAVCRRNICQLRGLQPLSTDQQRKQTSTGRISCVRSFR